MTPEVVTALKAIEARMEEMQREFLKEIRELRTLVEDIATAPNTTLTVTAAAPPAPPIKEQILTELAARGNKGLNGTQCGDRWNNRWYPPMTQLIREGKVILTKIPTYGHHSDLYRLEQYRAEEPDTTETAGQRSSRKRGQPAPNVNSVEPAFLSPEKRDEIKAYVAREIIRTTKPTLRQQLINKYGLSHHQANGYVNLAVPNANAKGI